MFSQSQRHNNGKLRAQGSKIMEIAVENHDQDRVFNSALNYWTHTGIEAAKRSVKHSPSPITKKRPSPWVYVLAAHTAHPVTAVRCKRDRTFLTFLPNVESRRPARDLSLQQITIERVRRHF